MSDIEKFIEARITEREASLERAYGGRYRSENYLAERLREYGAMRAIVEIHSPVTNLAGAPLGCAAEIGDNYPCETLRAVAAAWSDHKDYRKKEWKP